MPHLKTKSFSKHKEVIFKFSKALFSLESEKSLKTILKSDICAFYKSFVQAEYADDSKIDELEFLLLWLENSLGFETNKLGLSPKYIDTVTDVKLKYLSNDLNHDIISIDCNNSNSNAEYILKDMASTTLNQFLNSSYYSLAYEYMYKSGYSKREDIIKYSFHGNNQISSTDPWLIILLSISDYFPFSLLVSVSSRVKA